MKAGWDYRGERLSYCVYHPKSDVSPYGAARIPFTIYRQTGKVEVTLDKEWTPLSEGDLEFMEWDGFNADFAGQMYHVELTNGTAMILCDVHIRLYSTAAWSVVDKPDGVCWICPEVN